MLGRLALFLIGQDRIMWRAFKGVVLFGVLEAVSAGGMVAQEIPPQELFSPETILRFSLETDLEALRNDRSEESEEILARILMLGSNGEQVEFPLQVRTRGRFRLQKNICPFPPLRLNLPEGEPPTATAFDGQDKLKLVTYCHDRDSFEQNVLEEYLAYRIYNQLTDVSFRVQLAEITYLDTGKRNDPLTRMGFLIEDEDAMAARVGGMILDIPGARATDFEPGQMGVMFLFQYMIGNIDWSTANSQNLSVLRVGSDHYAVPFDFDWSGLVDAPYVGPSPLTERLHDSVRERLYLGTCWEQIDFPGAFRLFEGKKEAILSTIQAIPHLTEANIRSASEYIEEFYEFIGDPDRAESDIRRMCRGS
ncbi:MAG: hypothetical protein MUO50_05715 [Longimicrobiales bacterium]|nr:hypothetical protein [Longimicrobiales bacterium]